MQCHSCLVSCSEWHHTASRGIEEGQQQHGQVVTGQREQNWCKNQGKMCIYSTYIYPDKLLRKHSYLQDQVKQKVKTLYWVCRRFGGLKWKRSSTYHKSNQQQCSHTVCFSFSAGWADAAPLRGEKWTRAGGRNPARQRSAFPVQDQGSYCR